MATKPKSTTALTTTDIPFVIEGLRKLALQRDTLKKYALLAESAEADEEGEGDEYNGRSSAELTADIDYIRGLLATLGDTRSLVLKSERKAKPAKAKATKKPAKAKATAKA